MEQILKPLFHPFDHEVRALILGVEPEIDVLFISRDAFFEITAMGTGKNFFINGSRFFNHSLFGSFHEFLPDMILIQLQTHESDNFGWVGNPPLQIR
jgi:hypothetical protein